MKYFSISLHFNIDKMTKSDDIFLYLQWHKNIKIIIYYNIMSNIKIILLINLAVGSDFYGCH